MLTRWIKSLAREEESKTRTTNNVTSAMLMDTVSSVRSAAANLENDWVSTLDG